MNKFLTNIVKTFCGIVLNSNFVWSGSRRGDVYLTRLPIWGSLIELAHFRPPMKVNVAILGGGSDRGRTHLQLQYSTKVLHLQECLIKRQNWNCQEKIVLVKVRFCVILADGCFHCKFFMLGDLCKSLIKVYSFLFSRAEVILDVLI